MNKIKFSIVLSEFSLECSLMFMLPVLRSSGQRSSGKHEGSSCSGLGQRTPGVYVSHRSPVAFHFTDEENEAPEGWAAYLRPRSWPVVVLGFELTLWGPCSWPRCVLRTGTICLLWNPLWVLKGVFRNSPTKNSCSKLSVFFSCRNLILVKYSKIKFKMHLNSK